MLSRIRSHNTTDDQLKEAVADAVAKSIGSSEDPLVRESVTGMAVDYIKKQSGRQRVLELAADDLSNDPPENDAEGSIDDDWMSFLKAKVDEISSEELHLIFGKILAGEVRKPGSFSKKSISTIIDLSPEAAKLFEGLCNVSAFPQSGARVLALGMQSPGQNGLAKFGLPFTHLNELNEYGLIISDYNSYTGVNFRWNAGQCFGVKVGHRRCRWSKQEGPARGAFLLSRVEREVMRSGAPWTA